MSKTSAFATKRSISSEIKRSSGPSQSVSQTILWPVVSRGECRPDLTEEQFSALEVAGGIVLTPDARRALNSIAEGWTSHDRVLHSPRPGEFRRRLSSVRAHLEKAYSELDLYGPETTIFDRHLLHWLRESGGAVADEALAQHALLPHLIEFLKKTEQSLPPDGGRARPMDEDRFIHYLADQFEACGGKARAYQAHRTDNGYAKTPFRRSVHRGYARTPFRQFVHRFYDFLSLDRRRTRSSGLDEAIRRALIARRKKQTV
jgi:hypothetical protein